MTGKLGKFTTVGTNLRDLSTWRKALIPLSWVYGVITDLRNLAYDRSLFRIDKPACKVISVGNLTVGGTGKTPMIEFLTRTLLDRHFVAIVSRGYGRKTRGVYIAGSQSTAAEIGDEPLQFFRKFKEQVPVVVAEKRILGATAVEKNYPQTDMILLDDALQHRSIYRDYDILLTDYNRPFYEDHPFPAGNLRERRRGARRADLIVVTKCPSHLTPTQKEDIKSRIRQYSRPDCPVIFSTIRYGAPQPYSGSTSPNAFSTIAGLSGIAQNQSFEQYLRQSYPLTEFFGFPDHHDYSDSDLVRTGITQNPKLALITTEKDWVKLQPLADGLKIADRCFYIPIEVEFNAHDLAILMQLISR